MLVGSWNPDQNQWWGTLKAHFVAKMDVVELEIGSTDYCCKHFWANTDLLQIHRGQIYGKDILTKTWYIFQFLNNQYSKITNFTSPNYFPYIFVFAFGTWVCLIWTLTSPLRHPFWGVCWPCYLENYALEIDQSQGHQTHKNGPQRTDMVPT